MHASRPRSQLPKSFNARKALRRKLADPPAWRDTGNYDIDSEEETFEKPVSTEPQKDKTEKRKQHASQRRNTTHLPSYVPSYIVPVEKDRTKSDSSDKSTRSNDGEDSHRNDYPRSRLTLEELRQKYTRDIYRPSVPVKDKVALMESWNSSPKPRQQPKRSNSNTSPQRIIAAQRRVQYRSQVKNQTESIAPTQENRRREKITRDSKHRRSMSDPNLHKSFQAMKQLWDKKVEQSSKPAPNPKPVKTRGYSVSVTEPSELIAAPKPFKDTPSSRVSGKSALSIPDRKKNPTVPAKPKYMEKRKKEESVAEMRPKSYSVADPSPGNLVKNRAKMFDHSVDKKTTSEPPKPCLNRNKNRSSSGDSLHSGDELSENGRTGLRSTALQNAKNLDKSSPKNSANNNKRGQVGEIKSELARLLDNEESIEKSNDDSDDLIISRIRKDSGNLARERRKNSRRGSNQSDSDSSCSAASSLSSTSVGDASNARRTFSRENSGDTPSNRSPVIKSYLHRNAAKPETNGAQAPPKAAPRSYPGTPERKGGVSSAPIQLPPSAPRRKSSLHKERTPSPTSVISDDPLLTPTEALHRKLSYDAAKRASADSGTGSASTVNRYSRSSNKSVGNRDSVASAPEPFKRGGSFSSLSSLSKTPPAPPPSCDKPTRARSASSSPMPSMSLISPGRPNVPPPPPPASHKHTSRPTSLAHSHEDRSSSSSTPTVSSRFSLLSTPGDAAFNAEEEYNKILDVIATPTNAKRYRTESGSPNSEESAARDSYLRTESSDSPTNPDSLEVPARGKPRTSDNDSCSDYDPSDADDEGNQPCTPSHDAEQPPPPTPTKEPLEVKLHNIAKELLSTEVTYVDVLHLIDEIFHKRVLEAINKKQISSDVKNIFSNVSAIYQFHSGFLLPQLKERLDAWESKPRLGDIMTQAAPFLKMYSLYVQNFDEAMKMVKYWSDKSNNFTSIIKQIQQMPECGQLTLQHHMLSPVQRIPRYKLLLEDYLKRLPEDSPDRPDSEHALQLISQAATHSNETMKQSDKFNKLLSVYNNLIDINLDIVDVSRELIMEGKIIKISARNGEKHERYLYLFNDMLLCCTPVRRLQGKSYKVTAKIDLDGMNLKEVNNMTVQNTFCVNGTNKSMEFATNSPEEKEKWVKAINDAVESFLARKTSFMKSGSQKRKSSSTTQSEEPPPNSPLHLVEQPLSPVQSPIHKPICFEEMDGNEEKRIEITCTPGNQYVIDIEDHDLGKRAPRWIKDNEVTMCMQCSKAFNRLLRRRHHCRACGRVICTECSEHKLELAYESGKAQKVCNKCHAKLTGRKNAEDLDKKGVLETEADTVTEHSVISEYLHFMEVGLDKKKAWANVWCVIPEKEPCLYVYGANQDVRAIMTMPLPGFKLDESHNIDREFAFKLVQAGKTLLFSASNQQQKERWMYAFSKAADGEELTREDIKSLGRNKDGQSPDELTAKEIPNGSRLSSSSAESSAASSESSRPPSLMDKNNSYTSLNSELSRGSSAVFAES